MNTLTVKVRADDLRLLISAAQYAQRLYSASNGHPIPDLDDAVERTARWLPPLSLGRRAGA